MMIMVLTGSLLSKDDDDKHYYENIHDAATGRQKEETDSGAVLFPSTHRERINVCHLQ